MSDLDRDPRDMRDDARAWARLNYPAITVGRYADAADQIQRLRSQLAAALAKVEEYKLDAARYRWLRQPDIEMAQLFDWKQQKDGEHGLVFKSDAELDAAIDSAMTAKEGG